MNLTNECCIRLTPIGFDADYLSEGISTTADDRATPSEMPDSAAISYAVGATNTTASTVVTDTDAHLTASTAQTTAAPLSPQTSAMLSATPTGSYASHTLLGQAEAQNHYHTHDALVDKESDVTGVHLCSPLAYTPSILANGGITANTPAKSTSGTYTANSNTGGANNYAYNIPSPQTLYQSHFGGASVLPTAVSSTTVVNNNALSKANSTHTLTAATTVGSPFFASVTSANKSAWPSAMSRSVSTASLSDPTNNQHHHLGPTSASSYGVTTTTTVTQSASNAPGSMTTLPTPVFTPTNNVVSSFATPTTTMTAMFTQNPNATANNNTIGVPQGLGSSAHVPLPPALVTSVPTLATAGMPKFSSNPFAAVAGSGAGLSSLHPKSPSPPCAPLSIGTTNTSVAKANADAHINNTSSVPVSQPHALSPSLPPPPPPLPQPPTPLTGTISPTHNEATIATANDTTTTAARSCPVMSGTGWTSLTPTSPPPPPPPTIGSTAVTETNGHTLQPGNYLTARRASDASLLYAPIRPVDNYVTNRSNNDMPMQDAAYGPQGSSFGRGGLACPSSHSRLTSPNSSCEASFYGSNGSCALPEATTTTATTSNGVASAAAMHASFAQAEGGGNNNREGLRVPGPRNANTNTTVANGWSYVTQGSNGTSESALPANSPPPLLRRFATQPATTAQESTPHAEGNTGMTMPGSKQQEDDDDEDYTALYLPFTDNVFSTTVADDDDEAALPPPPPLPVQLEQERNNDEATHMGLPHSHSLPSSSPHYHDPQGLLASQPADSSCAELDELTAMPSMQSIGHDESPVTRTETRTGETLVPVYDPDFKDLLAIPTSQIFHRPHPCFGVSRLVLCRNFVLEKGAESCGKGARCKFVHADTTNVTRSSIHVNYAWRSLELCTYARLPSGDMLRVLAPNERQPSEWIPSERVLVTRGSVNWRQHSSPLSHCAHYYFNRMCNRGERCNFIHAVYVDPNVQGDFKRAPAPVAVASAGMVKHGHNSNNGSSTRSVSSTTSMHEGHASLHNGGPFMVSAGPSAMTTPRMGPDMLRPNPQTQQPQLFTPVPTMAMMMMPAPVPSAALLTPQGSRAHNASGAGVEGPEAQMMIRSTLSSPLVPSIQSPTASLTPFGTSATGATLLQGAMMTTSHAIPVCAPNHTTSAGPTLNPGALLSPMGHMHAAVSMPPSPNFLPQQQQRLSGNYAELGVQPRSAPPGPFTMMVMSPLSATPLQVQTPRSTSPMLGQGKTTTAAVGPFAARSSSENNTVASKHVANNHFMQSYRTEATDARLSPFSPPAAPTNMNSRNTTPPQATHLAAQPAPPIPFEPTLGELSRDYDGLLFSPHRHNNNAVSNGHGIEGKDIGASAMTNGAAAMTAKVVGSDYSDTMTENKMQDFGSIGPTPQDHANTTTSTTITSTVMTGSQPKSSGITVPTALYSDAIWSDLPDTFATQEDNEDVIGLESLLDLSEDKKLIES